jgi:hypothetical protein
MKRILSALIIIILASTFSCAQSLRWLDAISFGKEEKYNNIFISSIATYKNGFISVGSYDYLELQQGSNTVINNGNLDGFITWTNENGEHEWSMGFGGESEDNIQYVGVDEDDNIYLSGRFNSLSFKAEQFTLNNRGEYDIFLIKIKPDRTVQWAINLGTQVDDFLVGMQVAGKHVYLAINQQLYTDTSTISSSILIKIDGLARVIWAKKTDNIDEYITFSSLNVDKEENILLSGTCIGKMVLNDGTIISGDTNLFGSAFHILFNQNGIKQTIIYDSVTSEVYSSLIHNEHLYLLGIEYEIIEIDETIDVLNFLRVAKYHKNGNLIWSKRINECHGYYSAFMFPYYSSIHLTLNVNSDGALFVYGTLTESSLCFNGDTLNSTSISWDERSLNSFSSLLLIELDNNGQILNTQVWGNELTNASSHIISGENGKMHISGCFQSTKLKFQDDVFLNNFSQLDSFYFGHGYKYYVKNYYSFIATFDNKLSTFVSTTNKTTDFSLYPNPTNNTLYLQSEAFSGQPVQVQIFSVNGRLVRQQNISGTMPTIQIQTGDLPPGMYVVGVLVDGMISTQKFMKY